MFGMINHVTFPTHILGSSLDPVVSDMSENLIHCSPLGLPGSSDHYVISTQINIETVRDPPLSRTIWLWNKANWKGFREALSHVQWDTVLIGSIDNQVRSFTEILLMLQELHVLKHTELGPEISLGLV